MLGKYKKYYPIIEKKRNIFEKLIEKIKISKTLEKKLYYAEIALKFAVKQPTGYYTSSFLENFYLEYAKTLKFSNNNQEYKKNTFLHVLTSGYNSGGHTRVIERWIENAPISQEHSVVVLKPVNELSVLEKNIKEKNGNYILFEKNIDLATRALKLRELATLAFSQGTTDSILLILLMCTSFGLSASAEACMQIISTPISRSSCARPSISTMFIISTSASLPRS